jgi:nucleoside-diphosphate-sugar epimerase
VFLLYDFFFFRQFNVTVLTMHRWFDIKAAERDLGFRPIIGYQEGWAETIAGYRSRPIPAASLG